MQMPVALDQLERALLLAVRLHVQRGGRRGPAARPRRRRRRGAPRGAACGVWRAGAARRGEGSGRRPPPRRPRARTSAAVLAGPGLRRRGRRRRRSPRGAGMPARRRARRSCPSRRGGCPRAASTPSGARPERPSRRLAQALQTADDPGLGRRVRRDRLAVVHDDRRASPSRSSAAAVSGVARERMRLEPRARRRGPARAAGAEASPAPRRAGCRAGGRRPRSAGAPRRRARAARPPRPPTAPTVRLWPAWWRRRSTASATDSSSASPPGSPSVRTWLPPSCARPVARLLSGVQHVVAGVAGRPRDADARADRTGRERLAGDRDTQTLGGGGDRPCARVAGEQDELRGAPAGQHGAGAGDGGQAAGRLRDRLVALLEARRRVVQLEHDHARRRPALPQRVDRRPRGWAAR